ncbi:tetratricopeptide repeat protein 39B isoform X1 [Strongylocentrotus purpuratus]|uniref:Tetratricopeptide repeat protein 39B n=1 Tax=Strongylocentrotus purpuratus TaxID=7668 RepID=A0A7M7PHZ6_STRPU|nr:tetratricopeptide repeat protein 39B isoform X1 [Strongylocentrotus purpuratus]
MASRSAKKSSSARRSGGTSSEVNPDAGGSSDEEQFQDAMETFQTVKEMDLATAIEETTVALNLFLNNRFSEARAIFEPWSHASVYHALGHGTISYLQAVMTFDPADIQEAIKWIKNSIEVANRFRKKTSVITSMSKMMWKTNYNTYTDEEVHAELCYAESLLERAILSFIQDDNLINFIKGGLKIRNGYHSYKSCVQMFENRTWPSARSKQQFESGVKFGSGTFNLCISMLPKRILKLLEFVGFSGNRIKGLTDLERASKLPCLRSPMCSMVIISYHSIGTYVFGTADGDIEFARQILEPCLRNYPKGVIFLFLAARIEEISGNMDEAIEKFQECIASQQEWRQFHHLCYWELMWCHAYKLDWPMAAQYAHKLCEESRWSKAIYHHQQASFLAMHLPRTEACIQNINDIYAKVPDLKQRIAGKSIPMEKFAVSKAKKQLVHGTEHSLVGLELIYIWNGFSILAKKKELLEPVLLLTEATLQELKKTKGEASRSSGCYWDDYSLAMLLKGITLRYLSRPSQAELCFQEVISNERDLHYDHYVVPYATLELGLLYLQYNRLQEAKTFLTQCRHHNKKYMLENRLHFKMHAALDNLKTKMAQSSEIPAQDSLNLEGEDEAGPGPEDGLESNLTTEVSQDSLDKDQDSPAGDGPVDGPVDGPIDGPESTEDGIVRTNGAEDQDLSSGPSSSSASQNALS